MTKEELALKLTDRQVEKEITRLEAEAARQSGLVVVHGASDDIMRFRGAIKGMIDCYGGGEALILNGELFTDDACKSHCQWSVAALKKALVIEAVWREDDPCWVYKTDIPHATFTVLEGEQPYCKGIVFNIKEVLDEQ